MNPQETPIKFVLLALLCPAFVTGLVWLATLKRPALRGWIGALAVGLGYVLGHCTNLGLVPGFPPSQSTHALFYIAIAAMVAGVLRGASSVPSAVGWSAAVAVALAAPWVLLRNLLQRWSVGEIASTLFFTALAITALVSVLDRWAERRRGASVPLVLWLSATLGSIAQVLGHNADYAKFGATLAGVFGACVVFAWIARDTSFARGPTLVFTVVTCCFSLAGVLLADLPRASGLLLFYAPLAAVAIDRGPFEKLSPRTQHALRLLAVALAGGAAVLIAYLQRADYAEY